MSLEHARLDLFRELAHEYGLSVEQAEWVYTDLVDRGLIDYDVEKEVLLAEDEEEEE